MAQLGMDVEAVESVGRQLKQSATSVDQIIGGLDKTVNGLLQLWEGPDAQRFVQSWPTFRKSLIAAQASVAGLGQSALNNASEQRDASGVKGSGGSSGGTAQIPSNLDSSEIQKVWERVRSSTGNSLTAIDIGRLLASAHLTASEANKLVDVFPELGKVFGPMGLALGASSIGTDFANGEYLKGALDLIPEGSGAALWAADTLGWGGAASLGPLGLGVSVFAGFVDATIPVTGQQQDDAYAMGMRAEFGEGVDPKNPSLDQASAMSQRYAPPLGVAMMISDQMDSTANKIFPWNWGKK